MLRSVWRHEEVWICRNGFFWEFGNCFFVFGIFLAITCMIFFFFFFECLVVELDGFVEIILIGIRGIVFENFGA